MGLRIHASTADSRQPAHRVLRAICLGNAPCWIFRYSVERLSPVRSSTAGSRRIRSGLPVVLGACCMAYVLLRRSGTMKDWPAKHAMCPDPSCVEREASFAEEVG